MTTSNRCDPCGQLTCNSEDEYGEFVCDDCVSNRNEQAYERFCSDFYGGSGPRSLLDQQIEAMKLK